MMIRTLRSGRWSGPLGLKALEQYYSGLLAKIKLRNGMQERFNTFAKLLRLGWSKMKSALVTLPKHLFDSTKDMWRDLKSYRASEPVLLSNNSIYNNRIPPPAPCFYASMKPYGLWQTYYLFIMYMPGLRPPYFITVSAFSRRNLLVAFGLPLLSPSLIIEVYCDQQT